MKCFFCFRVSERVQEWFFWSKAKLVEQSDLLFSRELVAFVLEFWQRP